MATRIQLRRDSAAEWSNTDPILSQGEMGVEIDTGKMKVGDGETSWIDLGYFGPESVFFVDDYLDFGLSRFDSVIDSAFDSDDIIFLSGEWVEEDSSITLPGVYSITNDGEGGDNFLTPILTDIVPNNVYVNVRRWFNSKADVGSWTYQPATSFFVKKGNGFGHFDTAKSRSENINLSLNLPYKLNNNVGDTLDSALSGIDYALSELEESIGDGGSGPRVVSGVMQFLYTMTLEEEIFSFFPAGSHFMLLSSGQLDGPGLYVKEEDDSIVPVDVNDFSVSTIISTIETYDQVDPMPPRLYKGKEIYVIQQGQTITEAWDSNYNAANDDSVLLTDTYANIGVVRNDTLEDVLESINTFMGDYEPGGGETIWEFVPGNGLSFMDEQEGVGIGVQSPAGEAMLTLLGTDPFNSPHYSLDADGPGAFFTTNSWTENGGNYEKTAGNGDVLEFVWDGYELGKSYHIVVELSISAGSLQFRLDDSTMELKPDSALSDSYTVGVGVGSTEVWFDGYWYDPEWSQFKIEVVPSEDFAGSINNIKVCDPRRSALAIGSASGGYGNKLEVDYQGSIISDLDVRSTLKFYSDNKYLNLDAQGFYINFDRGNVDDLLLSGGDDDQMTFKPLSDLTMIVPIPPESGTFKLVSTDGVLSWELDA